MMITMMITIYTHCKCALQCPYKQKHLQLFTQISQYSDLIPKVHINQLRVALMSSRENNDTKRSGQMSDAVNMLVRTPSLMPYWSVWGSSPLHSEFQFLFFIQPGTQQAMAQAPGSLPPSRGHRGHWGGVRSGSYRHLGSDPAYRILFSSTPHRGSHTLLSSIFLLLKQVLELSFGCWHS